MKRIVIRKRNLFILFLAVGIIASGYFLITVYIPIPMYNIAGRAVSAAQQKFPFARLYGDPTEIAMTQAAGPPAAWVVVIRGDIVIIHSAAPGIPEKHETYHQMQVRIDPSTGQPGEQQIVPPALEVNTQGYVHLSPLLVKLLQYIKIP